MADSQKPTLYEIYKQVCFDLGSPATLTTPSQRLAADDFLNMMNSARRTLATASQDIYRLAILIPERNWVRYVARPYSLDGGIIRIDLQGQTRTLLEAGDCRNFQYEDVCRGTGTAPNPVGSSVVGAFQGPDSCPMVAFPSECDIGEGDFPPALFGDRELLEPLTAGIFDIRVQGYGGNDPTNADDYPIVGNPNSYLRDIFLMYLLRRLTYTTGTNGAIPYNPDEWLNQTWTTILGWAPGLGAAAVLAAPNNTIMVDGVVYTVAVIGGAYNPTTNAPMTVTITSVAPAPAGTFTYIIRPDSTPWQTISTPADCNRWGQLFEDEARHSARPRYIAFNQWWVNLPDDLEEIRRLWEIPMDMVRQRLDPDDSTADATVEEITTGVDYVLNRTSGAVQLFPIQESRFSWQKWMETQGWLMEENRDTGYYLKTGDRFCVVPRSRNPRSAVYALLYVALDDKFSLTMPYADFQTMNIDLHGAQQEFFIDFILWRYHKSNQGSDAVKTKEAKESFYIELAKVKEKMAHRHQQKGDAPMIARELPLGKVGNLPYHDPIGDPDDWIPDVVKDRGNYGGGNY